MISGTWFTLGALVGGSLLIQALGPAKEDARPVIALVDLLPHQQGVAFESKLDGCRFYGNSYFDGQSREWRVVITTETCAGVQYSITAHVVPSFHGQPLLRAGDEAVLSTGY